MGHPIIMGRKTYESIGKPLPGRLNIVITKDVHFNVDGVVVVHSLQEALDKATSVIANGVKQSNINNEIATSSPTPRSDKESELFILGGGQIFQQALPITDRLYLTIVDHQVPADVFFPEYEKEFTKVIEKEEKTDWEYPYRFLTLERN